MGTKRIIFIILNVILYFNLNSQNYDYKNILKTALNYKFDNKNFRILQIDFSKSEQYYKNISSIFKIQDASIILEEMYNEKKEISIKDSCRSNEFKFISVNKFVRIVNRNNNRKYIKIKKNDAYFKKKYAVYQASPIIIYQNHAIIEVCEIYTYTNSVTYGLLLEKKDNKWEIKQILYVSGS